MPGLPPSARRSLPPNPRKSPPVAQYALALRMLVMLSATPGGRPEWAAGNFTKPQDYAATGTPVGYDVSADLGNGVVLFHRK